MRRPKNMMPPAAARRLLASAAEHRLATTTPDGTPVLRTLNGAVHRDALYFHAAPVGEKARCVGRPAVVAADEVVARIPSHWLDPDRACPASTWYRSAQAHGRLQAVDDLEEKAHALQALMAARQPEGQHAPIRAADPRYTNVLRGLLVMKVPLAQVTGKALLGQGKASRIPTILAGLWDRGGPGDLRGLEIVRSHHPQAQLPRAFSAPPGYRLHVHLPDPSEAADLLVGQYWTDPAPAAVLANRLVQAAAWVGVRAGDGALVATASAMGDGHRAWIMDVAVHPRHQRRGLGHALMRLLLDHPRLRAAAVGLATRDAHGLYARFGFTASPPDAAPLWRPRP